MNEFFEGDLSVTVLVYLPNDIIYSLFTKSLSEAKNLLDFICWDGAAAVLFRIDM